MEKLLSTSAIGARFGVSKSEVLRWVKDGMKVAVRLKKQFRIRVSDAQAYLERREFLKS